MLAVGVRECGKQVVRLLFGREILRDLVAQGLSDHAGDQPRRLRNAFEPVLFQGSDHPSQGRFSFLVDRLEAAQERDPLGIGGQVGIEDPHGVEVLAELVSPGRDIAFIFFLIIDNGHPGYAG